MDIFEMGIRQVEREGQLDNPNAFSLALDRAITIRRALDRNEAQRKNALKQWKNKGK